MTESGASRNLIAAAAGRVSEWLSRSRISFWPGHEVPLDEAGDTAAV
jgi:hypothetical protein